MPCRRWASSRAPNPVSPSPAGGCLLCSEGPGMGFSEVLVLQMSVRCAGGAVLGCNHPAEATEHRVCGCLLSSTTESLIFTLLLLAALLKAPHPDLPSSPVATAHSKPQMLLFPRACHQGEKCPSFPLPAIWRAGELALLSSQQFPGENGCFS